jgi:LysR family transcriptional regulator, transcriptional activator for bauABCD operon
MADSAVQPEDVARARFVARRQGLERDLAAAGNVSYQASVENVEAQAHLILSSAYIGFLPEHYAEPWVKGGQLRAIQPARYRLDVPIVLAVPVAGKPNRAAEAFCGEVRRANAAIVAGAWPAAARRA